MLDRAFCADVEMGEARIAVIGLMELRRLLTERAVSGRLRRMDPRPSSRRGMKVLPPPSTLPVLNQRTSS